MDGQMTEWMDGSRQIDGQMEVLFCSGIDLSIKCTYFRLKWRLWSPEEDDQLLSLRDDNGMMVMTAMMILMMMLTMVVMKMMMMIIVMTMVVMMIVKMMTMVTHDHHIHYHCLHIPMESLNMSRVQLGDDIRNLRSSGNLLSIQIPQAKEGAEIDTSS